MHDLHCEKHIPSPLRALKTIKKYEDVTATCIEDWNLAKSSSADERNYTEGTYKGFEYFTYDGVEPAFEGDTVDNSIYLYVHGSSDHYMEFQINVQKDGKMLEFSNKQAVVESLMDHISEVEG